MKDSTFQFWTSSHLAAFLFIEAVFALLGGFSVMVFGQGVITSTGFGSMILFACGAFLGMLVGAAYSYRRITRNIGRGIRTGGPLPGTQLQPAVPVTAFTPAPNPLSTALTLAPATPMPRIDRFRGHKDTVVALAVSSDGRLAISGGKDRALILWDVQTGFEIRSFEPFAYCNQSVAFSPDGKMVAAGGLEKVWDRGRPEEGLIRIWDTETGQELRRIEFTDSSWTMRFLPDGRHLAVGTNNHVRIWDIEGPTPVALISPNGFLAGQFEIRGLALSPSGRLALAGCHITQSIRLIDLALGTEQQRFDGHGSGFRLFRLGAIVGVAFAPDGKRFVSGSWDQTARVWSIAEGKELTCFRGHCGRWGWRGVVGVAWISDDTALSASEDGTLRTWNTITGQEEKRFNHGAGIACLATTPNGKMALTGGTDGVIRVWNLA